MIPDAARAPRETWDYLIRAYAPANRGGGLLLVTGHRGEASRDIEIAAYRNRMARGDVSHIEVIALIEPYDRKTLYA